MKDRNLLSITAQQQKMWATGDFNQIGARQNVRMAEALCETVDPHAGDRVLDVACGSGTAALIAARRYCDVIGIDYVPALIERAKMRATAEGLEVEFRVEDAQDLSFPNASFDVVLSVYGVHFAPDQEKAAREMMRVCCPGGTIALASPIPEGWSGDFFATIGKYVPRPPGLQTPLRWGTEAGLEALLGSGTGSITSEKRRTLLYFRSIEHATDVFLSYFGPAIRASEQGHRESLQNDLKAVFSRYNLASDGTAVIENMYLLTVAIRAGEPGLKMKPPA
ncbi:methyltransferase domain-containing protein [Synechococcales cyanobacterium C]|uniref:Methyltransferase domain-containing protein n=1 Tax=Petrachloros mirabilis ULC683 TaxID=2781853 RepID=A0A8K1ZYC4_9CYAN|nr:class I SAM-dependent methyltransferase [Petrachloros mirabilis]NCJ06173.1 methyltransferase domain-containing protein [Petrachloros mirabilis ULC683]